MTILTWALAILLSGCAGFSQNERPNTHAEDKQDSELHFRLANGFYLKKDFSRALTEYKKSVALDPLFTPALNNLALTYFYLKKPIEAKNHLLEALKISPQYTEARNNLARVYLELEQLNEAEAELKTVLNDLTFTEQDKAWSYFGLLQYKKKDYKNAIKSFQTSLRLNRNSCFTYLYFARTLSESRDAQASSVFDKTIEVCGEGQNEEALYYSALHYQSKGDQIRARARLEDLVQLYPYGEFNGRAKNLLKKLE